MPSEIPKTALYWLNEAKNESNTMAERLFYMENAYNHVVNALLAPVASTPTQAEAGEDTVIAGEGPSSTEYEKWLATRPDLLARFANGTFSENAGYEIWRNAWLILRDAYAFPTPPVVEPKEK